VLQGPVLPVQARVDSSSRCIEQAHPLMHPLVQRAAVGNVHFPEIRGRSPSKSTVQPAAISRRISGIVVASRFLDHVMFPARFAGPP